MECLEIPTPMGWFRLQAEGKYLTGLEFTRTPRKTSRSTHPVLRRTAQQLEEYFQGSRTQFDLPLRQPGTEFQQSVWNALCRIPYGKVVSYGQLAARIGRPNSQRAVGNALGKNAIPVIVPCHRVIAQSGKHKRIGGFSSGLHRKRALFEVEHIIL